MKELIQILGVPAMVLIFIWSCVLSVACGESQYVQEQRAEAFEGCMRTISSRYSSFSTTRTPAQTQAYLLENLEKCMEVAERLYPQEGK